MNSPKRNYTEWPSQRVNCCSMIYYLQARGGSQKRNATQGINSLKGVYPGLPGVPGSRSSGSGNKFPIHIGNSFLQVSQIILQRRQCSLKRIRADSFANWIWNGIFIYSTFNLLVRLFQPFIEILILKPFNWSVYWNSFIQTRFIQLVYSVYSFTSWPRRFTFTSINV